MNPIFAAAWEVERVCRAAGYSFCFIGGIAVQRWGQPRMTVDVDVTIVTGFGNEDPFVDRLLGVFAARIADARAFALEHRILLLASSAGIPIDVSLGAMPFEEHAAARGTPFSIGDGRSISTCSAEDLVVHKAFAGRDKDWLDIRSVIARSGSHLDRQQIFDELVPLLELKDDTETEGRLRTILG